MESLLLSFNTVFPLFFMIVLGYVLVRFSKLDDSSVKKLTISPLLFFSPHLFFIIYTTAIGVKPGIRLLCSPL